MRRYIFILLVIVHLSPTSHGQPCQMIDSNTLRRINQIDDNKLAYSIVQTNKLSNDQRADYTSTIEILYDTNIVIIYLPIPDEEVKNFSVDGIEAKRNMINLETSQGGGAFLMQRLFIFKFVHRKLYLHKVITKYLSPNSKRIKKEVDSYRCKLQLSQLHLIHFL